MNKAQLKANKLTETLNLIDKEKLFSPSDRNYFGFNPSNRKQKAAIFYCARDDLARNYAQHCQHKTSSVF